jgi:hypothetical protein
MLETLLGQLNGDLHLSENKLIEIYKNQPMRYPLVFVMGPMRSGTTLFMQWLANTGLVAYPTNLLSRFFQAPIIGAKMQLLLTDPRYNFRDELGEFSQQSEYKSENGKTKGVLAPNEFWYFWRSFLAEPGRDVWSDDELRESMDTQTMLAELAGIMSVFEKPFAAKGMLFNYNIPFLDSIFDKIVFVQITRDPVANVASVLDARRRQLGNEDQWYSFKIPEYEKLKDLEPIVQVAGQVHCINRAVTRGLSAVDESRKLVVQYEEFCADPQKVFEDLTEKLSMTGSQYSGPATFSQTRSTEISERPQIEKAISDFACTG